MPAFTAEEVFSEIDNQTQDFPFLGKVAKMLAIAENTATGKYVPGMTFNSEAVSPRGARGILQVMPATSEALKAQGLLSKDYQFNPADLKGQIAEGLAALKEMHRRAQEPMDAFELAAMYNGGTKGHKLYKEGAYDKLPVETSDYFKKVAQASKDLGIPLDRLNSPFVNHQMAGVPTVVQTARSSKGAGSHNYTINDPLAQNVINTVATSMIAPGGEIDTVKNILEKQSIISKDAYNDIVAAIIGKSTATAEKAALETAVDTAAAFRRNTVINQMNLNPTETENHYMTAVNKLVALNSDMEKLKTDIDKRMEVSPFDNPFQWIINEVRLPGLVAKYNAMVGSHQQITSHLSALETIKKNAVVTAGEIKDVDLISQIQQKRADEIAADAQQLLAQAKERNAAQNAADALKLLQLSEAKLAAASRLNQINKISVAEKTAETEKEAAARQEVEDFEKFKILQNFVGIKPGNEITLEQFKRMDSKKRTMLTEVASKGVLGKDFAESILFQASMGDLRQVANAGSAERAKWVSQIIQQVGIEADKKATQLAALGKKVNIDELREAELTQLENIFKKETADLSKAHPLNPYVVDPLVAIKTPELKNNLVTQFIEKNFKGTAGITEVTPKMLFSGIAKLAADDPRQVPKVVQHIVEFYKKASLDKERTLAYTRYNLPELTEYRIKLDTLEPYKRSRIVNMFNPADVEAAIVQYLASAQSAPVFDFNLYQAP